MIAFAKKREGCGKINHHISGEVKAIKTQIKWMGSEPWLLTSWKVIALKRKENEMKRLGTNEEYRRKGRRNKAKHQMKNLKSNNKLHQTKKASDREVLRDLGNTS